MQPYESRYVSLTGYDIEFLKSLIDSYLSQTQTEKLFPESMPFYENLKKKLEV